MRRGRGSNPQGHECPPGLKAGAVAGRRLASPFSLKECIERRGRGSNPQEQELSRLATGRRRQPSAGLSKLVSIGPHRRIHNAAAYPRHDNGRTVQHRARSPGRCATCSQAVRTWLAPRASAAKATQTRVSARFRPVSGPQRHDRDHERADHVRDQDDPELDHAPATLEAAGTAARRVDSVTVNMGPRYGLDT